MSAEFLPQSPPVVPELLELVDEGTVLAPAPTWEALVAEELAGEFRILDGPFTCPWGVRFRAEDLHRTGEVILTILPLLADDQSVDRDRFLELLRATSLLDHPNLVPISAYGVTGALRWYAASALQGPTLAERIAEEGPLPGLTLRRIAQQVASALDHAHRRGIAHGALGADFVQIAEDGSIRVREIGIAAVLPPAPPLDDAQGRTSATPPSQGPDQVAFAALLRHCLVGTVDGALPADGDVAFAAVIHRASRPRPMQRFRDLLDLVAALDGASAPGVPIRPSLPIGKGGRPEVWQEVLRREFPPEPATKGPRRIGARPILSGLLLLTLTAAAVPILHRFGRAPASSPTPAPPATIVHEVLPATSTPPVQAPSRGDPISRPRAAAPVRRTPVSATPRRPAPTLAEQPRAAPVQPAAPPIPGSLLISSTPWGELSIDGRVIGNTPQVGVSLDAGTHRLRITRDGFTTYEGTIDVKPGEVVRLTGIVLTPLGS